MADNPEWTKRERQSLELAEWERWKKARFSMKGEGYGHLAGGEGNVANFQCSMVLMQSEMNIAYLEEHQRNIFHRLTVFHQASTRCRRS